MVRTRGAWRETRKGEERVRIRRRLKGENMIKMTGY